MAERLSRLRVASAFVAIAILLLPFADLTLAGHDPWAALGRMGAGLLRPDFTAVEQIGAALAGTLAFAIAGVALGAVAGFMLAPFYDRALVRGAAIALRSVHELFWALILMQALGIGVTTGVLAIALPYAGIFARVFADQIAQTDPGPARVLGPRTGRIARYLFAEVPLIRHLMGSYTLYRLECGLRSSAVLGFIGLPTLGFQLDGFFKTGAYGAASAVLICYIAMIATMRLWMRRRLVPVWLAGALGWLAWLETPPMGSGALWRFLTVDLVPAPLRGGWDGPALWDWGARLITAEALPGMVATLIVAQIALVLTGAVALLSSALIVQRVTGRGGALLGHLVLTVLRSLPDYMLAYLFLQVFGPSMLPAILALALHNGAIIGHLNGREAAALPVRRDAGRGLTHWLWDLLPRQFAGFLALCLYRWEIILRDTAAMGLLGVATLGFYVDGAIAELRLDRALVLLLASGALTALVDIGSRRLQRASGAMRVSRSAPAEAPT